MIIYRWQKKKESPYHNYDTETLISEIGLAIWPNSDVWTIGFNYDEAYFGLREKRTPYNLTTLRNSTSPILLGWVGELYNNTNAISSFYFSLMYSYKYLDANNHKKKIWPVNFDLDDFQPDTLTLNLDFKSYFGFNYHSKYLQSKAYSWVNLFLNPYNNWYFFGLKPQARLDYWSWKCGYQLDYKNGFFSCRPYLGLRYSLGSWLNPVDSVFGFYWPFRQIDNDINEVDLSTDVLSSAINNSIFATSNDELRPAMTGVYVKLDDTNTTFVATDGHRLVRYRRVDVATDSGMSIIIPRKALNLLKSTLPSENSNVVMEYNASNAYFHFNNIKMICRLIDERFPDYENVIPSENPIEMSIDRNEFLGKKIEEADMSTEAAELS